MNHMRKMEQLSVFADPRRDADFKILLGERNKDNMLNLLRAILDDPSITDIEYLDKEEHGLCLDDGESSFDLLCSKKGTNDKFIVEMQRSRLEYFNYRSVYYSSHMIQVQSSAERERQFAECDRNRERRSWDYKFAPVIFIGILENGMGKKKSEPGDKFLERYRLLETEGHRDLNVEINYIYLYLDRFEKSAEESDGLLEQFAYSLKNMGQMTERPESFDSDEIRKFYETALLANMPAEERHLIEAQRNMTTRNDMLVELREAKAEAKEEGRALGEAIGIAKGIAKGIAEGREEGREEVAVQMKTEGMDPDLIAKFTGLSLERIAELQ